MSSLKVWGFFPKIQHNNATVGVIFGGEGGPVVLLSVALPDSRYVQNQVQSEENILKS